jgi:hypothetical protein
MPVREAVEQLVEVLEARAREVAAIEEEYRASRQHDLRREPFGLKPEFDACCQVLRSALAPGAGTREVLAMEGALERLGSSLRRIDMSRLIDVAGLLYDNGLPVGQYLLPRAPELLEHLRRNVRGAPSQSMLFEVHDDSGREVLCLACLDAGVGPVPESTPLRGLAAHADLVHALGGQFHLWAARPGETSACRRRHDEGPTCAAADFVPRIEERLRHLADTRWHSQRAAVRRWLGVLDGALQETGSATLAFVILPRLHE